MKQLTKRFITMVLSLFVIMSSIPFTNSVLPNLIPLNQITAEAANYRSDYWTFPVPTRNLKKISPNQRGNDVKWFQSAINHLIVNGDRSNSRLSIAKLDVDGVFGTASRNATITFQKKYNLSADGIFGPASRAKMQAVLKPRNISHTHNYVLQKTVAATCGTTGYKEYKCTGCTGTYQESIAKKTEHSLCYNVDHTNFTITLKCNVCGYSDSDLTYMDYLKLYPNATRQDYYFIAFTVLCPNVSFSDRKERAKTAASIIEKGGYSSNIFLNYRRPNGTNGFDKQANTMTRQSKYVGKNNYIINFTYMEEFLFIWNKVIPQNIADMHIFAHGGINTLDFYGETLDMSTVDPYFNNKTYLGILKPKKIRFDNKKASRIYLYSCEGGTIDTSWEATRLKTRNELEKISTSCALARVCLNTPVISIKDDGCDYSSSTYLPVRHSWKGSWVQDICTSGNHYIRRSSKGTVWKLY